MMVEMRCSGKEINIFRETLFPGLERISGDLTLN